MTAVDSRIAAQRERVADAAARVIAMGGIEAANLRAIAAAMGATTGLLTRYFSGRRELLQFVLARAVAALQGHLQAAIPGKHGVELVRAAMAAALPLDPPRLAAWGIWAAFLGLLSGDAALGAIHRQFSDGLRALLIQGLREAQLTGAAPASLYPAHAADALIAQITGLAVRAVADPARHPPAKLAALAESVLAPLFRPYP